MNLMKPVLLPLAALLLSPLAAQETKSVEVPVLRDAEPAKATEAEVLFLRAFYFEKGERRFDEAVAAYRKFLDIAPEHRYARTAARNVIGLLNRSGKVDEATELRQKFAALVERVPVADRKETPVSAKDNRDADQGGAAAAPEGGVASLSAEQRQELESRLKTLKEQIAQAEGDESQVQRLTRQATRIEEQLAGRAPARDRGARAGRGGLSNQKPLTEMSAEELEAFQQTMSTTLDRLRESGNTERAEQMSTAFDKLKQLIKDGKLEEAEKLRAESMRGRRRRGG